MTEPPEQPEFVVAGHRLRLLDTGPRRYAALIDLIDGASERLDVLYYIYEPDDAGAAVLNAMVRAAGRGVAVTLIVDGLGSDPAADRDFFRPLIAAGGVVRLFIPKLGRKYLLRNHQKFAIADRARVIVGGFNIKADYFGLADKGAWRDLGLWVEGPAAARLADYFAGLAEWTARPRAPIRALNRLLADWSEPQGAVRWLMGGPTRRLSPWARMVKRGMRRARRVDMIAAYFAPGPGMLRRLGKAGRRGRVRIVLPSVTDNWAAIWASRFTYAGLLRRGVRIFEYRRTKLHTKLLVIDDAVHIGSANFDFRSLFLNLEVMLRIEDAAFAAHVRAYIDGEVADSAEVTAAMHKARSTLPRRIGQAIAYFGMSVLDPIVSRRLVGWGERTRARLSRSDRGGGGDQPVG
ncbi:phosphatidylserine/phosphatidylglycerophosphate/cardiolipin synthase family protein [Sphingomonas sp. BGYR3]|uniref:phospholipase D-like domain-containing protein n=1 Tax=Sphingomonas sp. BGYR3 TaxID=2975483 RepID=UPI0021A48724|nr:phosphatidylserine/phosphatidylglycerophosphate/cardiolipin synthase family protein [Sphingomonas sp. BGYR3]MDG5488466.1 phosphatidylserine/phosphatidylglycerophosphate/cardiolipin synthase family protein [Sphingomonas sp. BGYR3]